ncbi:hypothetical protein HDU97_002292 [Phlyctochytrium planicorne]|nr:hypothetical protein HDU97_002292 [Phlyctochytrium planicorne]
MTNAPQQPEQQEQKSGIASCLSCCLPVILSLLQGKKEEGAPQQQQPQQQQQDHSAAAPTAPAPQQAPAVDVTSKEPPHQAPMAWAVSTDDHKKDDGKPKTSWAQKASGGANDHQSSKPSSKPVSANVSSHSVHAAAAAPAAAPCTDAKPSPQELQDFCLATEKLWELDANKLKDGQGFQLDLGGGKKAFQEGDAAKNPLFKYVDQNAINKPTFKAFIALLDNYEKKSGIVEKKSAEEDKEIQTFISTILQTPVIRYAHAYLQHHNHFKGDLNAFGEHIKNLWFSNYKREVHGDSSAFEHVFCGEIRNGQVLGGHNWIQFWNEEKAGRIDYQGYFFPKRRNGPRPEDHPHILTLQFTWENYLKPMTTLFIGSSPEFEMALYTMAFYEAKSKGEDAKVMAVVEDTEIEMKVHAFRDRSGERIGSVYPVCQN